MATAKTSTRKRNPPVKAHSKNGPAETAVKSAGAQPKGPPDTSLYLYGVAHQQRRAEPLKQEGIDASAPVESVSCAGLACWVSRVSRTGFAEKISSNMENLDWLATAGVRHQKVVSELARLGTILPARFGTVFHNEESLARDISARKRALLRSLERVAEADEWGIKVFLEPRSHVPAIAAASGSDYLRRKASALHDQMQQRNHSRTLSPEVQQLSSALEQVALETAPGGKVSGGQMGLDWQISILLPRGRQKQFISILNRFSRQWKHQRRIECTGPWPPYSFVKV